MFYENYQFSPGGQSVALPRHEHVTHLLGEALASGGAADGAEQLRKQPSPVHLVSREPQAWQAQEAPAMWGVQVFLGQNEKTKQPSC